MLYSSDYGEQDGNYIHLHPVFLQNWKIAEDSSSSELEPDLLISTNLVFFALLGVVGGTDAAFGPQFNFTVY